jgi:hypothetical protein
VSYAWFSLPDFGLQRIPEEPPTLYRSVSTKLLLVDPNLLARLDSRSVVDIGFNFALAFESLVHGDSYHDEVRESTVQFYGGGGVGYTRELGEHFAVSLRGKLLAGRVTGSGYDLWINGVNTGSVAAKTWYWKMVSLSLFYRI